MIDKINAEIEVDWKKRALIYEEYLVTQFGITIEIFKEWLKVYNPEEFKKQFNGGGA